jgi:hypothetical protein
MTVKLHKLNGSWTEFTSISYQETLIITKEMLNKINIVISFTLRTNSFLSHNGFCMLDIQLSDLEKL